MLQLMQVFALLLAVVVICVHTHEDDVHTIQYNSDNFGDEVAKKNHFVMFYAPWCGHCKRLGPTWEQLAEMLNEEDSTIKIAKVDCTVDSKVCSDQDVTGYPTLKFFKVGDSEGVKFRGTRDLPSLTTFINEQLREGDEDPEPSDNVSVVNGLTELTADNFANFVGEGKHFVKFYAPWCGHCQNLAPTWQELAKSFMHDQSITIGRIDCTQSRDVCNQYEVKGYPTLLWIEDGKKVDKYQGDRTHEDLKVYVNKMVGSVEELADTDSAKKSLDDDPMVELNGNTFLPGIKEGFSMVKFFAPWCGHCKRLAPTWDELARRYADYKEVRIVKVDCTLEINKDLCNMQEVDGFPTIFLYKNGEKQAEYSGSRDLDDLVEFVHKHAITHDEL